jgi:hypothetical protein
VRLEQLTQALEHSHRCKRKVLLDLSILSPERTDVPGIGSLVFSFSSSSMRSFTLFLLLLGMARPPRRDKEEEESRDSTRGEGSRTGRAPCRGSVRLHLRRE